MNLSELIREKRKLSENIKNLYSLPKKNKALGLIKLKNIELINKLQFWLKELPVNFIIDTKENIESLNSNIWISNNTNKLDYWFDFIVCDNTIENICNYFWKWVTPIIIKDSHLSNIITEFNPLKNEWNSYLYEKEDEWNIFYAIARYLENYKFPFDNKNLVKNISEM